MSKPMTDNDRSNALNLALLSLRKAKRLMAEAGFAGTGQSNHIDVAWRRTEEAVSYLKSGMTMAGVAHKSTVEDR